ncbi:MAG: MBL fold metallo-hydrolase [Deltaproteobacteria bacterium]|nr:MBL fold metallo-hydrolase [Deltaproteobacteria bacterium]
MKIKFLGATGTVTGSKYLVDTGKARILVDHGLFQGQKALRERNWAPLPVEASSIDAVVVTHAHVDHIGGLPLLVRQGFHGPIHASSGSYDVAQFILPDSARLQEEDARYANRKGFSKHSPARPLYTEKDARNALRLFVRCKYRLPIGLAPGITAEFLPAGHIVGSAHVRLTVENPGGPPLRVLFSGDIGPYDAPILPDPTPVPECDALLVESTYGDRDHDAVDPRDELAALVTAAIARGGRIVIPAFAVGRTQEVLYLLNELREANRIPQVPIIVDSPMAEQATKVVLAHVEDQDEEMRERARSGGPLAYRTAQIPKGPRGSRMAARSKKPAIIISASGMATGGRVLHYLREMLPDPRNTVLLTGFQAMGTRGRRLFDGEKTVKIHGEFVEVNAQVKMIPRLSAHADRGQILRWLRTAPRPPRTTFVVHGEPDASAALRDKIAGELGWNVVVPEYLQEVEIG